MIASTETLGILDRWLGITNFYVVLAFLAVAWVALRALVWLGLSPLILVVKRRRRARGVSVSPDFDERLINRTILLGAVVLYAAHRLG